MTTENSRHYESRAPYAGVETFDVRCDAIRQTFRIQVFQPTRRKDETTRFPVVYATDANLTFAALKGIAYSLQLAEDVVPRFILVGIGYPSEVPWAGALLRTREFSFPTYPALSRSAPEWEGLLLPEEGAEQFFGAVDFLDFITNQIFDLVDGRYPTDPEDRLFFGHSAGGGFGIYAMLSAQRPFRRYILSSPSLSFHGEVEPGQEHPHADFGLDLITNFIASGGRLDGTDLYLSAGALEEFETGLEHWRMTSSTLRAAALLKAAPQLGLRLTTKLFERERHMTVWPLAFSHGIQAVLSSAGRHV